MTDNLIYLNENNVLVHSDSITINNVAIKNNLTIGNIQSIGQLNVKESIKIDGNINRKMENIEYQNINMNTNIVGNNINIYCKTIDLNMKDMIVSKPQVLLSDGINCTWGDYIDSTIPNNNTNSMLLDYQTVKYNVNFDTVVITNNPSINNTCIISEDSQLASPLYIKFDIDAKLKDYSTNTITDTDDFDYATSNFTDFNLDINGSSNTITKVEYKKAKMEFNINYSSSRIYKDDIVKLSYTGSLINPFSNIQFGNNSTYSPPFPRDSIFMLQSATGYHGNNSTVVSFSSSIKFSLYNVYHEKWLYYTGTGTLQYFQSTRGWESLIGGFELKSYSSQSDLEAEDTLFRFNNNSSGASGVNIFVCNSNGDLQSTNISSGWHPSQKHALVKVNGTTNTFHLDIEYNETSTQLALVRSYEYNGAVYMNQQNNLDKNYSNGYFNPTVYQNNLTEFQWKILIR